MSIPKSTLVSLLVLSYTLAGLNQVHGGPLQVFVTAATGGSSISADTVGGAWTTLTGPVLAENGNSGAIGAGTIILTLTNGFQFNTGAGVTVLVTGGATAANNINGRASGTTFPATVTSTSITITITNASTGSLNLNTLTCQNIQVRPTAGTPLAACNLTRSGTAFLSGIQISAGWGSLVEVGGVVRQLGFTTQPAGAIAGAAFATQPVVKSQDQFGNAATNGLPANAFVGLTLTSGTGPLQGTASVNLGMNSAKGTASFSGLRIDVAGNNKRLTATSTNGLTNALSSVFTVYHAAASKLVIETQPSSSATAGVALNQQPVVRIQDAYNNICTASNSIVTATRSAGAGTLLGSTNVAAVAGVVTYAGLAHPYATNITIQFTSGNLTAATSTGIAVAPNAYTRLLVLAPGQTDAPGTTAGVGGPAIGQTITIPCPVKVVAADAYGNRLNSVTNNIHITSSDGTAVLPANAALVGGTNSFNVTFNSIGNQTVTASDVTTGSQTGTSSPIPVTGSTLSKLQLLVPGEIAAPGTVSGKTGTPIAQLAGVAFSVTVNAVDANWNLVSTNNTISITSSDASASLPANAALVGGTRSFSIVLHMGGSATITASNLTVPTIPASTSPAISVGNAAAVSQARPVVAIHDSELTRALESLPAVSPTPSGAGTTGYQWWPTNWHYFVLPESLKETLRADGTAYEIVGDLDISAGRLLASNGQPRCPILISLAAEAIRDDEVAPLTNYVAAGGTLLVGSSAFTRNIDGTTRGDFALASQMGLHMLGTNLLNWAGNATFTKNLSHSLVSHVPAGTLTWQMPAAADEVSWGISPAHTLGSPHSLWRVQADDAVVIARGDSLPFLAVKTYGKGRFIYCAAMQPLIGHGGNSPGTYAYGIFRKAIELAFASAQMPVPKLSPWPYAYDAAITARHDLENYRPLISTIEASAQYEFTNGVRGDYYFCTGTLRVELTNSAAIIASLGRAVSNYGATLGSHNGGLKNPNNASLVLSNYDYWHWGPDEALDIVPLGYANGKSYALSSISNSFGDIEGWVPALTNRVRSWVGCYFNSTREDSYEVLEQLNVKTAGEQKLGPFPHWTLSTRTAGKRYSSVTLPVSDWFVGSQIAQATESGHTITSVRDTVDYYYGLGGLINLYSHSLSDGTGMAGALLQEYIRYGIAKPRVWSTNAAGIYAWWLSRSNAQVTPTYSTNGTQGVTALAIAGAADSRTAVEVTVPHPSYYGLQVLTNGVAASGNSFRTNGQVVKLSVGTAVTNAELRYSIAPVPAGDLYYTSHATPLTVPAPGILSNDLASFNGLIAAALVTGPANGALTLNANGGFSYSPAPSFSGVDSFSYRVSDGVTNSGTASVSICVAPAGTIFGDDFTRAGTSASLAPWQVSSGTWSVTNGLIRGASPLQTYGFAYLDTGWADYAVQAGLQFPAGAFGGGLGGRLNPTTGAHYAAWIYPEATLGGLATLRLIKFHSWTTFSYNGVQSASMAEVSLSSVGTNWHALKLAFHGNRIGVYYDGSLMMDVADTEAQKYAAGGVSLDTWTRSVSDTIAVDDLLVASGGTDQVITFGALANKLYGDPAFPVSATASSGLPVTFSIVSGPAIVTGNVVTLTGAGTVTVRASQVGDFTYNAAPPVDQSFMVAPALDGLVLADSFARPLNPGSLSPWMVRQGLWQLPNGALEGSGMPDDYSYAYIAGNWTNYSIEARVRVSSASGWGGGIGGRLNPTTGAHYAAWLYPEESAGGSSVLKLVKFSGWTTWSGTPMSQVPLPQVGTNWHTLKLEFVGNQITVYCDDQQVASETDTNFDGLPPLTSGGITAGMYITSAAPYTMSVDDVVVRLLRPVLTITADNAGRSYHTANPAFTGSIDGLLNGDNITAVYSTVATSNSPAGVYSIVPTLNDPDNKLENYNLLVTNGTLTITSAPLTASGITADNKPYDGTTAATIHTDSATLQGVFSGDNVTLNPAGASGAFADPEVGVGKTVYITGLSLTGSSASDYALISTEATAFADITPGGSALVLSIQANPDRTVTVTFSGTPGSQYVVQVSATLSGFTWQNLSTNVADAEGHWTFTESVTNAVRRYFRAATP